MAGRDSDVAGRRPEESTHWPRQAKQHAVDPVDVERLRIEVRAGPFPQFRVAFVMRVSQSLKQFFVSPGPTTVLWRAGPLPRETSWVVFPRIRPADLHERDAVRPTVAEVVLIHQGATRSAEHGPKRDLVLID